MPFRLTCAPSSYQRLMNHILKPHENTFNLVYLDDIQILSNTLDDHTQHLDITLPLLASHDIRLRLQNCFTPTHMWPLQYIAFAVETLNFNGLHANKSLLTPSNSLCAILRYW
jgi:hypothetical protein